MSDIKIIGEVSREAGITEVKSIFELQNAEAWSVLKILESEDEYYVFDPFTSTSVRRANEDWVWSALYEINHKKLTWKWTIPGPEYKKAA